MSLLKEFYNEFFCAIFGHGETYEEHTVYTSNNRTQQTSYREIICKRCSTIISRNSFCQAPIKSENALNAIQHNKNYEEDNG